VAIGTGCRSQGAVGCADAGQVARTVWTDSYKKMTLWIEDNLHISSVKPSFFIHKRLVFLQLGLLMNIFPFHQLVETKYIHLLPRQCHGCGECVDVCPEDVFRELRRTHHHHVRLKDPDACTGCKKCVRACEYGAIEYTYIPKSTRLSQPRVPGGNN
jgi:ferredoxin